jgi:cytidyltransferase-like protein
VKVQGETIFRLAQAEKIRPFDEVCWLIGRLRRQKLNVVLAQGVFDIVHRGHVGYLRAASGIGPGTVVVVGVENDETVKRNKGGGRPINPASDRLHVLAEFVSVQLVFSYLDVPNYGRSEDYLDRYRELKPDAVVVPTWDPHLELKQWQAAETGTSVSTVTYQHENSTTVMLRRLGYEQ